MGEAPKNRAIAHRRVEPAESNYFPTPPWATRALFVHVLGTKGWRGLTVEEPACGEGHMAYVLEEYFDTVRASDIEDFGYGDVRDFLDADSWTDIERPDWIITNPPFGNLALPFMQIALQRARTGVAMFVRTTQIEGPTRWRKIYRTNPPEIVAQYVERVPLHKGRWEPDGETFTAYCWLIWRIGRASSGTELVWIPPSRKALLFARDIERFGAGMGE
ncbi:hypothetical protein [Notoacmeibacter ruber]|uniref:Methyltransferase n=1 Tax=Notoacmeibacter ruber TaxID=2670375 RepID=A0A3L7JDY8_9HYPH|nr:hypothetical protein [Notoacmeibacter ruber]RLQ88896.1 hypothetical protein D8780_12335 [Notoacmeibacter ruber]